MKKELAFAAVLTAAFLFALPDSAVKAQTLGARPMPQATGQGPYGFGKTDDFEMGYLLNDVYTQGYYCDTSIPAKSSSGCELGTSFKVPPASTFDPLYITVPLGFNTPPMRMQCPNGLICIDHPATIDLTAIGGPANAMTPGHDHFTTTTNSFKPEWWNVEVIGVTSPTTYNAIWKHRSFAYIKYLIKSGDKTVTKPLPTNLFLYFAVQPPN